MWRKKNDKEKSAPIVFEVQERYNEDLQALRYLKDWIHQTDALLKQGKISEAEWNSEMRAIDGSIRELEEKYGI